MSKSVKFALLVVLFVLACAMCSCSVAQCYDSTGMATTCVYDAIKNPAQSHAVVYGEVKDTGIENVSCSADLRIAVGSTYTCKSVVTACESTVGFKGIALYAKVDGNSNVTLECTNNPDKGAFKVVVK